MRRRRTKKTLFVAFAEHTPNATSYRSEILGAIAAQLVLKAATRNKQRTYPPVPIYCDNKGVLNHGSDAEKELKEKQVQFDVLHVMKRLVTESLVEPRFKWVKGHSVEKKGIKNYTYPEIMNDLADELAGFILQRSIDTQNFIQNEFPFAKLRVMAGGKKLSGNLRREIDNRKGESTTQKYFAKKGMVRDEDFSLIWWDGMEQLMRAYPKMYRVWLTKHVSGCCGTNKQMSYWKRDWSALCPSCCAVVESAQHITRYRDKGRRKILRHSVKEIVDWMEETTNNSEMTYALSCYLISLGEITFKEASRKMCCEEQEKWSSLINDTNKLKWGCLLEGRLSKLWIEFAKD